MESLSEALTLFFANDSYLANFKDIMKQKQTTTEGVVCSSSLAAPAVNEFIRSIKRKIIPTFAGGNGANKAYALLGDKLIDAFYYEQLIREQINIKGNYDSGKMSRKRAMLVSNKNMARVADKLVVPEILSQQDYDSCSEHDKGTLLEALVGAVYEYENYTKTSLVKILLETVISLLESTTTDLPSKTYLQDRFQAMGLRLKSSYFKFEETDNIHTWRATFSIPPEEVQSYPGLVALGLDKLVKVGIYLPTRKEAEEYVCQLVLEHLNQTIKDAWGKGVAASALASKSVVDEKPVVVKKFKTQFVEFIQRCAYKFPSGLFLTEHDSSQTTERLYITKITIPEKIFQRLPEFPKISHIISRSLKSKKEAEEDACSLFMETLHCDLKNEQEVRRLETHWIRDNTIEKKETSIAINQDVEAGEIVETPLDNDIMKTGDIELISFKSRLSHLLNHYGISKPADYFFTEKCGRQSNYVLYECYIQIPIEIVDMYQLPKQFAKKTYSMQATSKTLADESAAANVLEYFNDHPPPLRPNITKLISAQSIKTGDHTLKKARINSSYEDEMLFSEAVDLYTIENKI